MSPYDTGVDKDRALRISVSDLRGNQLSGSGSAVYFSGEGYTAGIPEEAEDVGDFKWTVTT